MTDPRAFFKLHNGMPENPKVAGLSDAAFRALIELWCYCSRNLTDGHVASAMANRLAGASPLAELVAAGLAIEDGDDIWMHDYLKHQQSKAEVEKTRANRRKAGAAGGRAKASALASAKQEPKQTPSKTPSKSVPDIDTDTDNSLTSPADADDQKNDREDIKALCAHLSARLTDNGVKHSVTKTWKDAARLLLDRDGRDPQEARRVLDWATSDPFWKANIQSMPKFREKYDQLRLKADADRQQTQRAEAGTMFWSQRTAS